MFIAAGSVSSDGQGSTSQPEQVQLINMQRRHLVIAVPMAIAAAAAALPSDAQAAGGAVDTESKCRECMGLGVTPCECARFVPPHRHVATLPWTEEGRATGDVSTCAWRTHGF